MPQAISSPFFLIGRISWKTEKAKRALLLIKRTVEEEQILGGICAASEFLAAHGFLNRVKHTNNGTESLTK